VLESGWSLTLDLYSGYIGENILLIAFKLANMNNLKLKAKVVNVCEFKGYQQDIFSNISTVEIQGERPT
jgi:hypothetical protein